MTQTDLQDLYQSASEALLAKRTQIVDAVVAREFSLHPDLAKRYGSTGRDKATQDGAFHLSFLANALAVNDASAFVDYVAWAKVVLSRRHVLTADLTFHLECLSEVVCELLPVDLADPTARFIQAALSALPQLPEDAPTTVDNAAPLSPLAHQYFAALLRGRRETASQLVLNAVAAGSSVKDIYVHVFQPGQYEIGRLWQTNRISVAQEHYCTAATQLIMSQLYEHVFSSNKNGKRMVATCVADNLHEIGVRMIADLFEMAGWDTYYLGANVPHSAVIAAVVDRSADVLAISAAMSPHVGAARDLIAAVRANPDAAGVTILVGGRPFNRDPYLWAHVGADGFARDADQAISRAYGLVAARAS